MHKNFLVVAALLGALTVAIGAFGAHGMKQLTTPESLAVFETGVRYQFYHVFALLVVAILYRDAPGKLLKWSGYFFIAGILLFSGSLYLLTVLKISGKVGYEGVGIITPFGGLFFIVGWFLMAIRFLAPQKPEAGTK